ncbi:MAG: hypothetical protein Q7I89_03470 [Syntrophales bacterium]|nr:hypothetical protein [Syntrophales bacterium]
MFQHENIITQPIFFLFVAFSFILTLGYFWGRRQNRKIFLSALQDLVDVVRPDDQTFTNIGGAIGYHANLYLKKKDAPFSQVDATITMLPRHSWLYLPFSKLIRKYDRLFITLYLKRKPLEELHLIEKGYSGFMGTKISNAPRLQKESIHWGAYDFFLFYQSGAGRDALMRFTRECPDPGIIRHIAVVPEQKKGFVFMIPLKGQVARGLSPVYRWISTLMKQEEK